MAKEDKSREFRFENIEKTRSYFIKEKNKNELISQNVRKVYIL